jgi:hypothetical protein
MNTTSIQPNIQPNIQPVQEKVYKTPAYIRKAIKDYTERQKANNKEQFTQRKRAYDKKYYEKFKKNDNTQEENKN